MKRFTDQQGTEWCVLVTDQALADLKRNAGLDLATLGMSAGEAIQQRMTQDATVVVVSLLPVCKGQRLQRGISQTDFGALVEGVYPAARDALLDALVDWAKCAAVKARLRRGARAVRAEAARTKEQPKAPAEAKKPIEPEPKKADAKK
jgi:hypothetical protein